MLNSGESLEQPRRNRPARLLNAALSVPIRAWQLTRPLRPPACRFYPSCSDYALAALDKYGPLKGTWLAVRRIGRCHPFHAGGYDPLE